MCWKEGAIRWVQTMSGEDRRRQELQSIVMRWMKSDPARATNWINGSSLPEETKAKLLATTPEY